MKHYEGDLDITLYYWDFAGRAEPIRQALRIGGVAFKDVRFSLNETTEYLSKSPSRKIPFMVVNGECYVESKAQLRFAGRLSGLYPKEMLEMFRVDEAVDYVDSLNAIIVPVFGEHDTVKKKALITRLFEGPLKDAMTLAEKHFASILTNGLVTGKLSIADLRAANMFGSIVSGVIEGYGEDYMKQFPTLMLWTTTTQQAIKNV